MASSGKPKRRSATVFSRDEIGVEQLQSLKEKFADGDLNEKEFVSLFREIIDASLSETQLTELFQKIDANSDGTVDWDELTNYMFLSGSDNSSEFIGDDNNSYYETAQPDKLATGGDGHAEGGAGAAGGEGSGSAVRPLHHHKDLITRVLRLDKPYSYLTASKDGSVRTWNANTLAFQSVITTGKNWITDCCVMRRSNRLAVASMNRTLGFYDLNSNQLIGEINEYSKKQAIPLCLEYVEKPADEREALVIGDDTGGITVMTCSNQWLACDGRSNSSTASNTSNSGTSASTGNPISTGGMSGGSSGGNNPTNAAGSASLEAQGFSSRTKFKKHTDWVTRVKWVNDIRAIVATSLDTNISILDIDRMVVKFEYNRHKKGVFDIVWCASTRLMASCGMERDISIWNPYSSQRTVGTLRGHTSSVLHLASDDDNYQIISAASDNTFKVWDVRNHRCLQTFVDHYKSTGGAENRISALLYDAKQPCLISGTTHVTRWPFKVQADEELDDESKERPMCIAAYNSVFHQVVTAEMSSESVVKTWSAETGDEICSFANAHGTNPVTAISFDYPGRRLLTGGHDGLQLKMWNFSNGALVKQFLKHEQVDSALQADSNGSSTVSGAEVESAVDASSLSSLSSSSSTPRRRKVREIMMLPPSFGVDHEGRKGGAIGSGELPSPTKTRLGSHEPMVSPRHQHAVALMNDQPTTSASANPATATENPPVAVTKPRTRNRYREKEVTSILDIERNLRVGMGDYICQRFVCSVGWDRSIFVWADKNDESEALPVHVLPNAKTLATNPAKGHSMDILTLVYIPPAYIATSGLDGRILLWSLNSGEFVTNVFQSSGSIETMYYAQKIEMLFASGDTGQLVCIDRSMTAQGVIALDHPNDETVTALRCDKSNTHLVTGDAAGHVKVWDLSVSRDHEGIVLSLCCTWRPAPARILGLEFIEHARMTEFYLLISGAHGDVSVWTLDGVQVGCFGKHRTWQLGRPTSYASSVSSCVWSGPLQPIPAVHFLRCSSIVALSSPEPRETFLLEDSMPKPGEVWVCVSGHRARAMNMNNKSGSIGAMGAAATGPGVSGTSPGSSSYPPAPVNRRKSNNMDLVGGEDTLASAGVLSHRLADNSSDINDLITVVKVTRGEIVCWDGNCQQTPVLKTLEMIEFVRKAGWTKHMLLSQFIGRIYRHEPGHHFRVAAVAMNPVDVSKPERKAFTLIDTHGLPHGLLPLNESVSMVRLKLQESAVSSASATPRRESTVSASPRKRTLVVAASANNSESDASAMESGSSGSGMGSSMLASPPNGPSVGLTLPSLSKLPLIPTRVKREMGGTLPKRSTVRNRHDPSVDFRRIHNPDDIPKSFRTVLQQKNAQRFDGVLPG